MGSDMSGMKDMDMGSISEMNHDAAPQSGGPDVIFHTGFPEAGLYKMWGTVPARGQNYHRAFRAERWTRRPENCDTIEYSMRRKNRENVVCTCSMHPKVQSTTPGDCPGCGMALLPKA